MSGSPSSSHSHQVSLSEPPAPYQGPYQSPPLTLVVPIRIPPHIKVPIRVLPHIRVPLRVPLISSMPTRPAHGSVDALAERGAQLKYEGAQPTPAPSRSGLMGKAHSKSCGTASALFPWYGAFCSQNMRVAVLK